MIATAMQTGIRNATVTKVILGGNGEGIAFLSEYISTDQYGTVTSNQAMADPTDERVSLQWKFIENPLMSKVMAEPYMVTKDRMGKLITLIARAIHSNWAPYNEAWGIGIDDDAVVFINGNVVVNQPVILHILIRYLDINSNWLGYSNWFRYHLCCAR
jgi:cyanophycinase